GYRRRHDRRASNLEEQPHDSEQHRSIEDMPRVRLRSRGDKAVTFWYAPLDLGQADPTTAAATREGLDPRSVVRRCRNQRSRLEPARARHPRAAAVDNYPTGCSARL